MMNVLKESMRTSLAIIAAVCLALAALPLAAGVTNITFGTYHDTINDAVSMAHDGDVLLVSTGVFHSSPALRRIRMA